ncbi:hypothetical protein O3P69_004626 [Scylla paramamosain]|uniref:Uncharacterized protein n=1 Tax=Scylla paramamosain TaxID=85552 RepID=A0AAW0UAG8_SCYPA
MPKLPMVVALGEQATLPHPHLSHGTVRSTWRVEAVAVVVVYKPHSSYTNSEALGVISGRQRLHQHPGPAQVLLQVQCVAQILPVHRPRLQIRSITVKTPAIEWSGGRPEGRSRPERQEPAPGRADRPVHLPATAHISLPHMVTHTPEHPQSPSDLTRRWEVPLRHNRARIPQSSRHFQMTIDNHEVQARRRADVHRHRQTPVTSPMTVVFVTRRRRTAAPVTDDDVSSSRHHRRRPTSPVNTPTTTCRQFLRRTPTPDDDNEQSPVITTPPRRRPSPVTDDDEHTDDDERHCSPVTDDHSERRPFPADDDGQFPRSYPTTAVSPPDDKRSGPPPATRRRHPGHPMMTNGSPRPDDQTTAPSYPRRTRLFPRLDDDNRPRSIPDDDNNSPGHAHARLRLMMTTEESPPRLYLMTKVLAIGRNSLPVITEIS